MRVAPRVKGRRRRRVTGKEKPFSFETGFRFSNMDCYFVQGSNDFMVPNGQYGFDVVTSPSSEDWYHWGASEFENDGFLSKHSGASAMEKLTNSNCDTILPPPVKRSRVSQVPLVETPKCSSASVACSMNDSSLRTSDDFLQDYLDFEMQNSAQNMDDIFLYRNSFQEQDPILLENPCELFDTTDSMHLPWNLAMAKLEDLETLTKDSTRKEDADPNSRAPQHVEQTLVTESSATTAVSEPACIEALVIKDLENVMLKLNIQTRICIRDGLYRLANRPKEQHNLNLCQSGMVLNSSSYSEICGGNSRQERSRSFEPKTNVIDRVIATLMLHIPENGAAFWKDSSFYS